MALPILDGNQSATTLSTILSSGQHIPAHTVVSLGTQAITDMRSAVSGSVVSISNFPATQTIAGTVTANVPNIQVCTQGAFAQTSAIQTALGVINENNNSQVLAVFGGEAVEGEGTSAFVQVRNQISGTVTIGSALPAGTNRIGVVTIGAGTVTIGAGTAQIGSVTASNLTSALAVYGGGNSDISVNIKSVGGQSFGQGQTWVPVAIAEGSLPAGTAQIGSVTASISGTVPISISSVTVGNSITIGSLPAISGTVTANLDPNASVIASQVEYGIAGYAADLANDPLPISGTVTVGNSVTIGSLPAISGTVTANATLTDFPTDGGVPYIPIAYVDSPGGTFIQVSRDANAGLPINGTVTANTFALQGTAVTTSNFTSTTASTLLAGYNATREVLTIFNEGAGNLHVCAGATCTTIAYQVRLSAGDYYEVPNHQTTITHSAVFATAGTARVTQVS